MLVLCSLYLGDFVRRNHITTKKIRLVTPKRQRTPNSVIRINKKELSLERQKIRKSVKGQEKALQKLSNADLNKLALDYLEKKKTGEHYSQFILQPPPTKYINRSHTCPSRIKIKIKFPNVKPARKQKSKPKPKPKPVKKFMINTKSKLGKFISA